MRAQAAAIRIAFDLIHVPSRVRHMRAAPLPDGIGFLLRIAAGDETAKAEAMDLVGRQADEVYGAAAFFIEQVLLAPDADSYRVLGASPEATSVELRRNMALLMRWLHPDRNAEGQHRLFAGRVTTAWNDLKTADRRSAYDQRLSEGRTPVQRRKSRRRRSSEDLAKQRRRGGTDPQFTQPKAVGFYGGPAGLFRRTLWRLFGGPGS